jgi:DNA-directed RNA polymerase subunit N (RpoN/RPB10)
MPIHIYILLCILFISSIFIVFNNRESFQTVFLGQPTKCFSCERQMQKNCTNANCTYLGGPSKCFSCEKQLASHNIPADLAQPTKCFQCEKNMM